MADYRIYTDSGCDMSAELLRAWEVRSLRLSYAFGDEAPRRDNAADGKTFYGRMRAGQTAKTAAVNPELFYRAFEKALRAGEDVLYIGFSSGLSTTFHSAQIAAEELREAYPDRRIITVDSLCASAGLGLLVYLTVCQRKEGAALEEAAAYAEAVKGSICHWFTVGDLVYLKRGGRISPAVALLGNALGVKPIMHMDDAGKLANVSKVRGRIAAIGALAEKYAQFARENKRRVVFISHGDCLPDAQMLAQMLKEKCHSLRVMITGVGAVIGAHSGPGTLALFFTGSHR